MQPQVNRAYLRIVQDLAADAEALNQSLIALRTAIFQIIEQLSPPRHHGQQPAPRVVILFDAS